MGITTELIIDVLVMKKLNAMKLFLLFNVQTDDTSDDVCYTDTKLNQHVDPLSTDAKGIQQYSSNYFVIVGNGLGLLISTDGNFEILHTSLNMKNALIVSILKKRLLYISHC